MLNNERWLAHKDLFQKHWVINVKPWVRTLGWFSDFVEASNLNDGWNLIGSKDLDLQDYIELIDPLGAEKKLYCHRDGVWAHIEGPVLFVYRKSATEAFIAGWAGPQKLIDTLLKKSKNPWDWPNLNVIDVNPQSAVRVASTAPDQKYPVIFMSNGETNADVNWARLKTLVPYAIRVDGINGRRNAFLKAAELAGDKTHFFVVTGKNWVTKPEVFEYVSHVDGMHTIFYAKNASNHLEYGHMGIGLYNVETVKNTPENFGLDFTEYGGVVEVPIVASEGQFATSPFEAWRTAFREVVKLMQKDTKEASLLVNRWETFAYGPNAEWVLQGARQAVDFYTANWGLSDVLAKTVEWVWLRSYFEEFGQIREVRNSTLDTV